jgi:multidrug efflux system membrane fusion protein
VEAEPGQVVSAGTPVVRIAQDGPRDVVFSVPEDKVAALKVGSPWRCGPGADQASVTGKVREVAASADPVTRTFAVKVALAGADAPALGTTVYAYVPSALGHAVCPGHQAADQRAAPGWQATAVWVLDVPA